MFLIKHFRILVNFSNRIPKINQKWKNSSSGYRNNMSDIIQTNFLATSVTNINKDRDKNTKLAGDSELLLNSVQYKGWKSLSKNMQL